MLRIGKMSLIGLILFFIPALLLRVFSSEPLNNLNPAAWGSDHVGKPVPEFMTGDECLFCHRNDAGPSWTKNRHQRTIRDIEPNFPALAALRQSPDLKKFADEAKLLLGAKNRVRLLKPAEEFGKLEMLSVEWMPAKARIIATDKPHWDKHKFGNNCAGCHATGADGKARTFSTHSIDCFSCHGNVTLEHTKNTSLMFLSKKRKDPARVVISICAQCHVRTGTARSTNLPYPNNFVAGDNLFRDFQVDFSQDKIAKLNPGDRHVLENVRAVVLFGKGDVTCLSCHDVHKQSSKKHHLVAKSDYCLNCHNATGPKKVVKSYEVQSTTCGY